NYLTSLDLSANTALNILEGNYNQLTSLGVSANSALTTLNCNHNQLTSLDVSANSALTTLDVEGNQLTSLNVSSNTALTNLQCGENELTSLDVSANTALTSLSCYGNQLTSLDVSSNTALTILNCDSNQLIHLNMKNGVTDQLTTFDATGNSLTCIEVNAEDVDYATANWTSANGNIDAGVGFSVVCAPEGYTYVPDDNFEQALIDLGYDDTLDDFVLTENISGLTNLNVAGKEIGDLTGIEGFTALTFLNVEGSNQLTSLDLSANTALTELFCYNNELTSLDVSSNTELTELNCSDNQLIALDVSSNTALTNLYCSDNQLTSLDVSANTSLQNLDCDVNNITELDVTNNPLLTGLGLFDCQINNIDLTNNIYLSSVNLAHNNLSSLDVSNLSDLSFLNLDGNEQLSNLNLGNISNLNFLDVRGAQLTSLDVGLNTNLTELYCHLNQISQLDITNNTEIINLFCHGNQLTTLDVSSNTALTNLSCNENQLTYLNMKNGVTDQLTAFDATGNSSLTCIETLDSDYATANWTNANGNIDAGVTFADICYASNPSYTYVPDNNFEQALIDLGYDDVINDFVLTANISGITDLDVREKEISDLTGIEAFTALTILHCENNQLTSLDVSSNTALTLLFCENNQLTSLDVSANTALTSLYCGGNQLTSLDVSLNTALGILHCGGNQLTSLDVSANTALTSLHCNDNQLTSLDLSNNISLIHLVCHLNELTTLSVENNVELITLVAYQNQLTSIDVSNNPLLENLNIWGNQFSSIDISLNPNLSSLDVNGMQLTSLDISANTALTNLSISDNELTSLNVSNNTALTSLSCQDNQLTSLDVSSNTALSSFECTSNQITALDVSNNTELSWFKCGDNQLTSLDVSSNPNLNFFVCSHNQLTSLDVSSNTALTYLYCVANQLTYLNMKNGLTDQLSNFYAIGNPSLTCIETLDPDYATVNWTSANDNIDAGVTFDVICGAEARTHWYVATTGSDAAGSGTLASPLANIQTAINATTDGDTVSVAAGTYVENINFNGKNIVVLGENMETTIIDGNQAGRVVTFENGEGETAVLSGFTIQNGYLYTDGLNGGGVSISNASPTLKNLIVKNCTAFYGGGIFVSYSSSLLDSIKVFNNTSQSNGGGVYLDYSNAVLNNVSIYNNTTVSGGHAAGLFINNDYQDTSSPKIIQSLIEGNTADYGAGAIYMDACNPIFYKTNIINNVGGWQSIANPGGVFVTGTSNASFTNCIIQDNSDDEIEIDPNGNPSFVSIYYSNVEGGQDSIVTNDNGTVTWGDGNIDVDPMFVDTANGNYHLLATSQLINAGHPDSLDSDGSRADMGAYPYLNNYSGPTWYIAESGNDTTATGASNDPFRSIQSGINFSSDDDSVTVTAGTYVENINYNGKNIAVIGEDRETTIIDGDSSGSVVTFANGEDSTAVLSGFTIQNGSGFLYSSETTQGGGIYIYFSNPVLENLIIQNNSATYGGGVHTAWSAPVLNNLTISGNDASGPGGRGGGLYIEAAQDGMTIDHTNIYGNTATSFGGGVYVYKNQYATPQFSNVTITNNTSNYEGGGVSSYYFGNSNFLHSIIIDNSPQEIYFQDTGEASSMSVSYSNIDGGQDSIVTNDNATITWGSGNIDVDPMFVDTASGDYHLLASSQLINAGHPDSTDSDGTIADIGAYPYLNSYSGPTWYITESGNDTTGTGASNDPFRSIQSGINFSSDADSVTVAAGTYVENINFRGRNIKVAGEDRETTIVTPTNLSTPTITFDSWNSNDMSGSVVSGFTFSGGTGYSLRIVYGARPTIEDCIITDHFDALRIEGSAPAFNRTIFHNNNWVFDFGLNPPPENTNSYFNNCTFVNNYGIAPDNNQDDSTIFVNSIIYGNQTTLFSGSYAIYYSNVEGGYDGDGNIDVDPMFVDSTNGDYNLLADSRLIDAGHPDSTDADGTTADMGAYYYDQAGQPVRVSNLITTPSADNVSVRWNANSAAASYNIYRSTDGSADFYSLSPYTTASDTLYVDETAADNTTYHYRVSAVDGESDEGILAYPEHGRTGPDSTAFYAPDVYLSRTTPPDLDAGTNFTLEGFFRFLETPAEEMWFFSLEPELSVSMFPGEAGVLLRLIHNENSYDGIVISD
ncbi:MAG: hypothetical protein HOC79_07290, partial [Euryarchaeota archaeon]|nr:hypothetical protein [Euryarchaeota archaeon]